MLSKGIEREVQEIAKRYEGLRGVLECIKEAVVGALEVMEGEVGGVGTMSVWVGNMDTVWG